MNSWLSFGLLFIVSFVLFLVFSIITIIIIVSEGKICIDLTTFICGYKKDPCNSFVDMIRLTLGIIGLLFCVLFFSFYFSIKIM